MSDYLCSPDPNSCQLNTHTNIQYSQWMLKKNLQNINCQVKCKSDVSILSISSTGICPNICKYGLYNTRRNALSGLGSYVYSSAWLATPYALSHTARKNKKKNASFICGSKTFIENRKRSDLVDTMVSSIFQVLKCFILLFLVLFTMVDTQWDFSI